MPRLKASALVAALYALTIMPAWAETPLRMAYGSTPSGRNNPHDSASITRLWFYAAAFDALTYITGEGKLEPWLATTWEQDSPTSWVFHLRPDVKFSNGKVFTAQDIADNVAYLSSAAGRVEPVAGYVATIAKTEIIDDYTIRFVTAKPDAMLSRRLSLVRIPTLAKGEVFTHDALVQGAVGTGPYKVDKWEASGIALSAAPGAWRRAPTKFFEAISVPNPIGRKAAITTGRIDIATAAFEAFEAADTSALPYKIDVDQIPAVVGLAYNTTRSAALRDVRVRKAIELAVDKPRIVNTLFSGLAKDAVQPARREFFGYDPDLKPTPHDPARAKALLVEAGYKDGLTLSMSLTSGATMWDQIFQAVADDLRKVGIQLVIEMAPEHVISGYHYSQGYPTDTFGTAYFSPMFDALDIMRQHSCGWGVAWYCDKDLMPLIEQAQNEADLGKREELTRQVMRRAYDNVQGLFMYESIGFTGYNRRIENFRTDFGFIRYDLMKVSEPKS